MRPTKMPTYSYECRTCGDRFDAIKSIADRKEAPCECGGTADLKITPVHIDWYKMGMDPGFPSAYEKWGDNAERRMRGLEQTESNKRLTESDVDHDAWKAKRVVDGKSTE